jgi:hypothetical protein
MGGAFSSPSQAHHSIQSHFGHASSGGDARDVHTTTQKPRESLNPLVASAARGGEIDADAPEGHARRHSLRNEISRSASVLFEEQEHASLATHQRVVKMLAQAHRGMQLHRGVVHSNTIIDRALARLGAVAPTAPSVAARRLGKQCGWLLKPSFKRKEQQTGYSVRAGTTHCFNPHHWWKRYFVIHGGCLVHYKNERDARLNRGARGRLELFNVEKIRRSAMFDAPAHCFDLVQENGRIATLGLPEDEIVGAGEIVHAWRRCLEDAVVQAKADRAAFDAMQERELQHALRAFPIGLALEGWLLHPSFTRACQLHTHVRGASEWAFNAKAYTRAYFKLDSARGRLLFFRREDDAARPSKRVGFIDLRRIEGVHPSAVNDRPPHAIDLVGPDRVYTLGIDPADGENSLQRANCDTWLKRLLIELHAVNADAEDAEDADGLEGGA